MDQRALEQQALEWWRMQKEAQIEDMMRRGIPLGAVAAALASPESRPPARCGQPRQARHPEEQMVEWPSHGWREAAPGAERRASPVHEL